NHSRSPFSQTPFPAFRRYASARSLHNFTLLWSCSNSTFAGLQGLTCCLPTDVDLYALFGMDLDRTSPSGTNVSCLHLLGSFRFELRTRRLTISKWPVPQPEISME